MGIQTFTRRQRLILSAGIGLLCLLLAYGHMAAGGIAGADFTFSWRAARAVWAGQNPYETIRPAGVYPYQTWFYYPLPAALAALPFAPLPPVPAAAIFFGLSAGLLAYALTRDGWQRLPLFFGAPFGVALATAQWSPLVTAAALLPGLEWLLACKPTLGLELLAYRPSGRAVLGGLAFGLLSLLAQPAWPLAWLAVARGIQGHPPPLLMLPLGPLLLLAAGRARSPEARLLLVSALVPQLLFFYDQLALGLIPRSWKTGLAYSGLTWLVYFAWRLSGGMDPRSGQVFIQPAQFVLAGVFLPALAILWLQKPPGGLLQPPDRQQPVEQQQQGVHGGHVIDSNAAKRGDLDQHQDQQAGRQPAQQGAGHSPGCNPGRAAAQQRGCTQG